MVDVVVIGGGMAGLSAAEAISSQGKTVSLIEKHAPGHAFGSSHGDGRIVRYSSYIDSIFMEMASLSYPMWSGLSDRVGESLIAVTGGLDIGPCGSSELEQVVKNCDDFDLEYSTFDPNGLSMRYPQFHIADSLEAVYMPQTYVALADKTIQGLWRLCEHNDVNLITEDTVVELTFGNGSVHVVTASGLEVSAEQVIVAAGNWTNEILTMAGVAGLDYEMWQMQVSHFPTTDDLSHSVGDMPVFVDHDAWVYGLPQIKSPGVKIGMRESDSSLENADTKLPINQKNIAFLSEFVKERFPRLNPEPINTYTCRYTWTPNQDFVLSRHPEIPQLIVGTGFSGRGFKYTPLIGEILSNIVCEKKQPIDMSRFQI